MSALNNFMSSEQFEFLKPLETHWRQIYAEYCAVAALAQPWHEQGLHNGLWRTFGIYHCGDRLPGEKMCPTTAKLVHAVPGLFIAGFSVLKPQCNIKPHVGYTGEVLRSHLGLACPSQAWLKVDDEKYHWAPGQVVVFDDTQMHCAGNDSTEDRVVLIVDFLRPDN
jgi:aspartyl/asparaginyl beta-hydroxylase (cupin superfamily)